MKVTIKELVLFSMFATIIFLGQYFFQFIPNVEVVSLFIIILSLVYERKVLYSIVLFIMLMGIIYGFGLWILGYIIIWPLLSLITILLKSYLVGNFSRISLYSGIFGFLFGLFYAVPYIFIGSFKLAFIYWIKGLPFDLIHMIGNYFIMLFVGKTLYNVIVKLNYTYFKRSI
ncbi:MAG: hypothetical protein Q4B63_06635 [Clostridium perfringens]|nr:hypothetical protein [Clostridium perfringens]